jgi:hypothetical protein
MSIDRGVRIALTLASVMALCFAVTKVIASRSVHSGEHSLAGGFGIVVDSMGNIYCGIPASQSIQSYDTRGAFRWSTRIDTADGLFRLRARPNGGVEVAAVRNQRVFELSANGDLISSTTKSEAYADFGPENEFSTRGPSGEIYELKNGAILVSSTDGTIRTVAQQSWWPRWFDSGLPARVMLGLSAFWAVLALVWRPAFRVGLARLAKLRWG